MFHHITPPSLSFPLDLELKIKVALVEVVHADVTVFSPAGIPTTLGVDGNRVERAKVPFDSADFGLEDLVIEPRLEFSLAGRGGGNLIRGLAATEDNELLLRGYGSGGKWCVCNVGLE
jgi:hypothetical protein